MSAAKHFLDRLRLPAVLAGAAAALVLAGGAMGYAEGEVSVALSLNPSAVAAGEQVTMTAVVTSTAGPLPAGEVTFTDNGQLIGSGTHTTSSSADGTVLTVAWTTQSFGTGATHDIVATFSPDDWSQGAAVESPTRTLTVGSSQHTVTHTTVDASSPVIRSDATVTFTAHVSTDDPGVVPPGGAVTFRADGELLGGSSVPVHDGIAVLENVGGWGARGDHTYAITADYVGDVFAASGGTTSLQVHLAHAVTLAYVGDESVRTGETAQLAAHVTSAGADVPGLSVTLSLPGSGESCTAVTDATGVASCPVLVSDPAGATPVTMSFAGDTTYVPRDETGSITVRHAPTAVVYTGPAYAVAGQPVVLSATVSSPLSPVPLAGTVTFTLGSTSCSALVTAGAAHCTVIPPTITTAPVTATFGETPYYDGNSATASVSVLSIFTTSLTYVGDATAPAGGPGQIAFLLKNLVTSQPLADQPVTLSFNGGAATVVTTDDNGIASLSVTAPLALGTYHATASFAGDGTYAAAGGDGTLRVITIPTVTKYTGTTTSTPWGAKVTVSATLTALGHPLTNKPLTFTLYTGETCSATTGGSGVATCEITVLAAPRAEDPVTVEFSGDALYLPSHDSGPLAVTQATSAIAIDPIGPVLQGSTIRLTGHLTPVLPSVTPIDGRTVRLSIGTTGTPVWCDALTDSSGTASCLVTVTAAPGDATTSATFAGDPYVAGPKTATGSTIVYAFAPGGGAFVIGDRTTTGTVTFWGAQWAKANTLSRGSAPNDFKGFAGVVTAPSQCGATWTTRPGNSTPPPNGPLPAYMAVVVSSSITKNGSSISGDVKKIVVVKTNAGYASNPGHAGTGTVVYTVCG